MSHDSADASAASAKSPILTACGRVARIAAFLTLCAIIGARLRDLGVADVLRHLPRQPLFYCLFLATYFAVPAFELAIYGPIWNVPAGRLAPVLIRKRILNEGVLGYSGEAYLGLWAQRSLPQTTREIFAAVKDSNLLSSFVSTSVTLVLTAIVLAFGASEPMIPFSASRLQISIGVIVGGAAVVAAYALRRRLLSLGRACVRRIAAVHFARLVFLLTAMVLQWSTAAPAVPFYAWMTILSAYLVATRLPFLPSYDLVLLGLGLSLTSVAEQSEEAVAGLFLAGAGLSQMMNLILFVATSAFAARPVNRVPPEGQAWEDDPQ